MTTDRQTKTPRPWLWFFAGIGIVSVLNVLIELVVRYHTSSIPAWVFEP